MNVLVVSFDALRADHLELYGYQRPTSPTIKAFADSAVVFDHAWSPSSTTPPSFAGMFTGIVPSRVFRGWNLVESPTLAGHFAGAGYSTAFFSNNTQLVATRGFDRGFSYYEVLAGSAENDRDGDGVADDEEILRRSLEWLRAVERPFLVWVHFISPHSPYRVRSSSEHLYDPAYRGRFDVSSGHRFEADSDAELRRLVDLYDGQVFFADSVFAQVVAALERSQHRKSTTVVLVSDHGEELGDHGGVQHDGVYQEVLRVPFVIRAPGIPPRRVTQPVSLLDLASTLSALARLAPFPSATGHSLLEPIALDRLRVAVAMTHRTDSFVAAARGAHKLVIDCRGRASHLYDLSQDPAERDDRGAANPRLVRRLAADAAQVLGEQPCDALRSAVGGASPTGGMSKEATATLLALGYLRPDDDRPATPTGPTGSSRLWADPNPAPDCDGSGLATTTLHWRYPVEWGAIEVRVEPEGSLFAIAHGEGSATTGRWVRDGLRFVATAPTLAAGELVEMRLHRADCRPGD